MLKRQSYGCDHIFFNRNDVAFGAEHNANPDSQLDKTFRH